MDCAESEIKLTGSFVKEIHWLGSKFGTHPRDWLSISFQLEKALSPMTE
jgi:hypothetical protein